MIDAGALGHQFADASLLQRALTHRSAAHVNNERLEFLGDALLNLLVAELIYEMHPRASEGEMTRLRAALVNGTALAGLARAQRLGDRLHLGPGELKSGGHRRDSILADAFEAVVAAVYLDGGWAACRTRVRALFGALVGEATRTPKDAKTRLQEHLQAQGLPLPTYELLAAHGEEHARQFEVACCVTGLEGRFTGIASSRRAAEQQAAEQALLRLVHGGGDAG